MKEKTKENVRIHTTAEVSDNADIGEGTDIWNYSGVGNNAKIGKNCKIGRHVEIDNDVIIGNNAKIQNQVLIYHGVTIGDGVFIGPSVTFTNDNVPRAVNHDGSVKDASDWKVSETIVKDGVAIGANSTIKPGITIGEWAMIGAGSVVTKDVPAHTLAYGNPAKFASYICKCGEKLNQEKKECKICNIKLGDIK